MKSDVRRWRPGRLALGMVLGLLVLLFGGLSYAQSARETPEYALGRIAQAIEGRDGAEFARYVAVDELLPASYDEGTAILARDIEKLAALYPDDWFFRHDTAFMQSYIAARRAEDLALLRRVLEFYLQPDLTPVSRTDGEAHWLATECGKFADHYTARVDSVRREEGAAVAQVTVRGDESDYGRLVPQLTLRLRLEPAEDGRYRLTRIENAEEIFYPIVKGVEDYWTFQGWQ